MTLNNVNFITISASDKELSTLREASLIIEKLERALDAHHTDRIIRADTHELIERQELQRFRGVLSGFNSSMTYWHPYTDMEEN